MPEASTRAASLVDWFQPARTGTVCLKQATLNRHPAQRHHNASRCVVHAVRPRPVCDGVFFRTETAPGRATDQPGTWAFLAAGGFLAGGAVVVPGVAGETGMPPTPPNESAGRRSGAPWE